MSARIGDTVLYRSWGTRDGRHQPADLPLLVVAHRTVHVPEGGGSLRSSRSMGASSRGTSLCQRMPST